MITNLSLLSDVWNCDRDGFYFVYFFLSLYFFVAQKKKKKKKKKEHLKWLRKFHSCCYKAIIFFFIFPLNIINSLKTNNMFLTNNLQTTQVSRVLMCYLYAINANCIGLFE